MTLRIIVKYEDARMAFHVGGSVNTEYKTFDIEAPQVESYIRQKKMGDVSYTHVFIEGVEFI